jgi:hypothetical protein
MDRLRYRWPVGTRVQCRRTYDTGTVVIPPDGTSPWWSDGATLARVAVLWDSAADGQIMREPPHTIRRLDPGTRT